MKLWLLHECGEGYNGYFHAVIADTIEDAELVVMCNPKYQGIVSEIEGQ